MLTSWGRVHRFDGPVQWPRYLEDVDFAGNEAPMAFFGQGRSYGDVALSDGGRALATRHLNRLISADWDLGLVRAEAGMTFAQLLEVVIPKGWFVPVTPGTQFVSLGGAVANDVHGKNHHVAGSLGAHVMALGLRRSDGERLTLSPKQNTELFALTISGLGLTGFIEWVELQLCPIKSTQMIVENEPYDSLEAFFALSAEHVDWPYTVAWVDCFARGASLGRGIFSRGRHALDGELRVIDPNAAKPFPADAPGWLLNRWSIGAFNTLYRARPGARFRGRQSYRPFFYPLDGLRQWNRLYGKRGFYQHQCLVPPDAAEPAMRELLTTIAAAGQGSFLAVMKSHGSETSPGRNSFCMEGTSLALDFANKGHGTLALLQRLDEIALRHGGRLYPAKDGHMTAESYKASFPNWSELETARDPAICSAFWTRVTGKDPG